jgi:hypothetical protein
MKMTVFWDAAPCSLVEIDRGFMHALLTAPYPRRLSSCKKNLVKSSVVHGLI